MAELSCNGSDNEVARPHFPPSQRTAGHRTATFYHQAPPPHAAPAIEAACGAPTPRSRTTSCTKSFMHCTKTEASWELPKRSVKHRPSRKSTIVQRASNPVGIASRSSAEQSEPPVQMDKTSFKSTRCAARPASAAISKASTCRLNRKTTDVGCPSRLRASMRCPRTPASTKAFTILLSCSGLAPAVSAPQTEVPELVPTTEPPAAPMPETPPAAEVAPPAMAALSAATPTRKDGPPAPRRPRRPLCSCGCCWRCCCCCFCCSSASFNGPAAAEESKEVDAALKNVDDASDPPSRLPSLIRLNSSRTMDRPKKSSSSSSAADRRMGRSGGFGISLECSGWW
mmetsp:Transcript_28690/g.72750  ORF Transcript_28690/g.72750 Transcript_28690/m.72750 type:complete len:341 (+) Transcript_28690:172-1194(+)